MVDAVDRAPWNEVDIFQIMMPFWGRVDHFQAAVRSVLAQSDPEWSLTIVDDVYPDLSAGEWAMSLGDDRIRYLRNDVNLRPSRNYNKCVGMAEAEFVMLMGCDDLMLPGYVGRMRELLAAHPTVDIVQPGVEVVDENGTVVDPLADKVKRWYRPGGRGARVFEGERLATSLIRGNWTYFPSLVWRTSRVRNGFREDLDVVQDLAKLFEIIADGGSLLLDDQTVFRYRRHSSSVSAVTGPDGSKFRQERTFFDDARRRADELGWRSTARAARLHLSSRLHAATELPGALRTGNRRGRSTLTRHVLGLPYRDDV